MYGLNAFREAKPARRSREDDSTERCRDHQPSCEAHGRGDRPNVPQRVRAGLAVRAGNRPVLPHASWSAATVCGADEPDDAKLCSGRGSRATAWQAMLRSSTGKTAARADAALASNQNIENNPMQSSTAVAGMDALSYP